MLALFEDPSIEVVLGVSLQQARQALESLDQEALGALGLGSRRTSPATDANRAEEAEAESVARKDRLRMTPAAKRVLEEAYKPKGHRKLQVTGPEVLAQILRSNPQILRRCCWALSA